MTKNEFIEKIDARIQAGEINMETAKTYAGKLRAGGKLSLMLQADGILQPGQCPLDLTEQDVETLRVISVYRKLGISISDIKKLLEKEDNIRNVIAFPKNKKARDLLMRAPSKVTEAQLKDVHIKLDLD